MADEISGTFKSTDAATTTATLRAPVLRCPVCKATDSNDSPFASFGRIPRISVSIKPYDGEYCQTCYAKWLSVNIPKLISVVATNAVASRPTTTGARSTAIERLEIRMSDLNCPHCGKEPENAITTALDTCAVGDAFERFAHCDHCNAEIGISVSKEAHVNRRARGYSDVEINNMMRERRAAPTGAPTDG